MVLCALLAVAGNVLLVQALKSTDLSVWSRFHPAQVNTVGAQMPGDRLPQT